MSRAIPLTPLVFALSGIGLMALSVYLMVSADTETPHASISLTEKTAIPAPDIALLTYHDPVRVRGYVDIVLAQSPFVSDRSAYSRIASQDNSPAEPEIRPEFVGTVGRGDGISALVVWQPGQPALSHSLGDETPWGILISATSSTLVFEGEKGRKELKLF